MFFFLASFGSGRASWIYKSHSILYCVRIEVHMRLVERCARIRPKEWLVDVGISTKVMCKVCAIKHRDRNGFLFVVVEVLQNVECSLFVCASFPLPCHLFYFVSISVSAEYDWIGECVHFAVVILLLLLHFVFFSFHFDWLHNLAEIRACIKNECKTRMFDSTDRRVCGSVCIFSICQIKYLLFFIWFLGFVV